MIMLVVVLSCLVVGLFHRTHLLQMKLLDARHDLAKKRIDAEFAQKRKQIDQKYNKKQSSIERRLRKTNARIKRAFQKSVGSLAREHHRRQLNTAFVEVQRLESQYMYEIDTTVMRILSKYNCKTTPFLRDAISYRVAQSDYFNAFVNEVSKSLAGDDYEPINTQPALERVKQLIVRGQFALAEAERVAGVSDIVLAAPSADTLN